MLSVVRGGRIHYQQREKKCRYQEKVKEQNEGHWHCSFFKHCWNEGLRLPAKGNCPEHSQQYKEYMESRNNDYQEDRQSVYDQLGERIDDRDQYKNHQEADIWEEDQWCPYGLTKGQKRRVQRLRC